MPRLWLRYSSPRAGKRSPTRNLILWKQPWERGQGPERLRPRRDGRAGTLFAFAIMLSLRQEGCHYCSSWTITLIAQANTVTK